jgi:hypothetical protein
LIASLQLPVYVLPPISPSFELSLLLGIEPLDDVPQTGPKGISTRLANSDDLASLETFLQFGHSGQFSQGLIDGGVRRGRDQDTLALME